ncbi:unnamed protein product [Enterobius vermicularis]|uniref:Dolichol-phosphate mannosyltransferase subunit 3 n=1 Tax=Enterobius vermicularis TaxID=51028 RepID=A0A0N4VAY7_ENTVE|nr:unnamed protein product [Enterobius vermicularis]
MSHLTRYGLRLVACGAVWLVLLQDWLPLPESWRSTILYIPVYAIVMLGVYAVCSVLYGVATFNDCPLAQSELMKEVQEAKEDLKARGVI